jgi:hypothetical protein
MLIQLEASTAVGIHPMSPMRKSSPALSKNRGASKSCLGLIGPLNRTMEVVISKLKQRPISKIFMAFSKSAYCPMTSSALIPAKRIMAI